MSSGTSGQDRVVPKGIRQRTSSGKSVKPVVRVNETPSGFDIEIARKAYVSRTRSKSGSGMTDGGGMIDTLDDGSGDGFDDGPGDDDGHDDDHHGDDHHDDDHDGHHGNHHYYNPNCYYYTHHSSPYGWWYIYGDYNGDGYTDYVCTNGSYSIYWYGWSGYYWGASPWYGFYGSLYNPYSWWYYSVSDRYRGTMYGSNGDLSPDPSYSTVPMDSETMPEAVPLSALEVARLEMSIGESGIAIDAYRAHLSEYPSDWVAVRELGIAMIRRGDRGDGISLVSYAYSMDPSLALDAVPSSLFEYSDRLMRDAVIDIVGWGHRNPSSSVWLTVAVLMQAEGRDGPGLRMIERSEGYGLDPAVASEMYNALTHR